MAIGVPRRGSFNQSQRQESGSYRLPAPYVGIDARSPFVSGVPEVCLYAYNLVPGDGGMVLRKGFREWQIGLDDGNGISVNTIITFDGIAPDNSEDRVFAVTNEGIWDVTAPGGTPVLKITFTDQTENAGFGTHANFITDSGAKRLMYADSLNGLFAYDAETDTWVQPTDITGVDETIVNFVTVHKGRIWLVERGSPDAHYLAIGAIAGATTKFYFGSKFRSGGALRGLFSWTVDGGSGIDDLFVGVSGAGDVVVYKGDDPTSADWAIRGVYFIGNLPKGPKFATEEGGELYLLSTYGVIAMNDLLNGVSIASASAENTSAKLAGQLRELMKTQSTLNGWAINQIPSEGGILITKPTIPGELPIQYYYNLTVGGWGVWRDLDIRSFGTWKNAVMFGDGSLRVCYMDRAADEVKLTAPPPPLPNAVPIEFSLLTSFSPLGRASVRKRVKYIRPDVISAIAPNFLASARYDYFLTEAGNTVVLSTEKVGIWDLDTWDAAVWGSTGEVGWNSVYGSFGMGRNVAVAYRGQSYYAMTLVGWDLVYDVGGMM